MRSRFLRVTLMVTLTTVGGFLTIGTGCISFIGETALAVADVCFIFDCTDAAGGALEFCDPAILEDCP